MGGLSRSQLIPAIPPGLSKHKCGTTGSASHCLTAHLHDPSFPSPPLLPVQMNASLIPWLPDFHAVQFSGSSGCFLFLNGLLSFFWLCEEAKHIYLRLHLWLPPRTTKRRTTTNLKTENNQNCQKIELHGSLTTKELKKRYSSRQVEKV